MKMDRGLTRIAAVVLFLGSLVVGCTKGGDAQADLSDRPVDQALALSNPALAMVERFNMGANLEQMANQVAMNTITYSVVADKHGENASVVVAEEIQKLIPNYQPRWNESLAQAYASHLSEDELRSLAVEGRQSSYLSKIGSVQNSVGTDMQANATPILTELVTEALSNAIK